MKRLITAVILAVTATTATAKDYLCVPTDPNLKGVKFAQISELVIAFQPDGQKTFFECEKNATCSNETSDGINLLRVFADQGAVTRVFVPKNETKNPGIGFVEVKCTAI